MLAEHSHGAAGTTRPVSLIPNGVDVEHFRHPQPRPGDLPPAPTAVYVGSLHDARLDVELVAELADALLRRQHRAGRPRFTRHGVSRTARALPERASRWERDPTKTSPRTFSTQMSSSCPHRVSPFTESLDPIKAYECLAIDVPTVATPVAGFRQHSKRLNVVDRSQFAARVREVLADSSGSAPADVDSPISWSHRARAFESILLDAGARSERVDRATRG